MNKGFDIQVQGLNKLKHWKNYIKNKTSVEQGIRDRICRRLIDKSKRELYAGVRQLRIYNTKTKERAKLVKSKLRGICNRLADKGARLQAMGFNTILEAYKSKKRLLMDKLKFIIKALKDKDARHKLMAYNAMRQRKSFYSGVKIADHVKMKTGFIKRIVDRGNSLQYQGVRSLTEWLHIRRDRDARRALNKSNACKRILDKNLRQVGQVMRQLRLHGKAAWEKERALIKKQRGIINRLNDASMRLCGMALNNLKSIYLAWLLKEEAKKSISAAKNGLLDQIFKSRKGHQKRELSSALAILKKHLKMALQKERVVGRLLKTCYGKNDRLRTIFYNKLFSHRRRVDMKLADMKLKLERLKIHAEAKHSMMKQRSLYDFRVNFKVNLTYRKCRKLYMALEVSDRAIDHTYRTYYRLLKVFNAQNKWTKRVIWAVTKNCKVDPQIAFWRLRDLKTKVAPMSAVRMVKLKKMGEILYKSYIMVIARSFWKIDKVMEIDMSMNSSIMGKANRLNWSHNGDDDAPGVYVG